jgi:anti-anti-sigma factor
VGIVECPVDGGVDVFDPRERLGQLLEPELAVPGDLTLELQGLEFMDSAGIHLFITAASALRGRGNLRLLDPSSHVARVIETSGLERLNNLVVVRGDDHEA